MKGYLLDPYHPANIAKQKVQKWEIESKTGLDYDYLAKLNITWVLHSSRLRYHSHDE